MMADDPDRRHRRKAKRPRKLTKEEKKRIFSATKENAGVGWTPRNHADPNPHGPFGTGEAE
jgi:hypothetical protein